MTSPVSSTSRSPSPDLPPEYEVEEILDYYKKRDIELYYIKWKNWDSSYNSWEPKNHLCGCDDLQYQFYLSQKAKAQAKLVAIESATFHSTEQEINEPKPKRRRGILTQVPDDPRPFLVRVSEFLRLKSVPSDNERKECLIAWKKSLLPSAPAELRLIRWDISEIENNLKSGLEDKLIDENLKKLREQLLYVELDEAKRKKSEELKKWEQEMNSISQGLPMITVQNDFDLEGRPKNFQYRNDCVAGPGITIPNEPTSASRCHSSRRCRINKRSCCQGLNDIHGHDGSAAYTLAHKLRHHVKLGTAIFECNKKCKCGPDCINRVVQDGRTALKLCIFRTRGCGWGVKTLEKIKKGSFVTLYIGEVIGTKEAKRRSAAGETTYFFDLDFNTDEKDTFPYTVDAAKVGNISHFLNHSCNPNLGVFNVFVNCLDKHLPNLAFFALRNIAKGEELHFDYDNNIVRRAAGVDDGPTKPKRPRRLYELRSSPPEKHCVCLARKCRKLLF